MTNPIIENLKTLQEIDRKIASFNKLCYEKEASLSNHRQDILNLQQILNDKKEKIKKLTIEINKKDVDLKDNEEKSVKLNIQLNTVRTNKEYSIISNEINSLKADKEAIEDHLLNLFNQNELFQKEIKQLEEKIKENNDKLNELTNGVNNEISHIKKEIDNAWALRQKKIEGIDTETLSKYEKIIQSKADKTALAKISGFTCTGCYMDIPPQQVNEILRAKELVCCKSCLRILYVD
jgi:predicted  nucleic acid-binding Zn-ribbon protein